jgi:hypothetical protein
MIDGGAPGEFVVFTCSTKETAKEYIKMLNEFKENKDVVLDIFSVDRNKFATGYDEGIDEYNKFFIKEVDLIDTVFPTINEAKQYFKKKNKNYLDGGLPYAKHVYIRG